MFKRFFRNIFITLNSIAALLLFLSYLSIYNPPAKAWYMAFFGLCYPVFLVINVCFVLWWLIRWKKAVFISLVTILIGFNYMAGFIQFSFSSYSPQPGDIKILSYNVRKFNYGEKKDCPASTEYIKFIRRQNPSIICMQEFFASPKIKITPQSLRQDLKKLPYAYHGFTEIVKGNSRFGTATYSKFPIVNKGNIEFKNSANSCIFTDLKIGDDTLRVYNCHLQSIHLLKSNFDFIDSLVNNTSNAKINGIRTIMSRLKNAYIKRSNQVDLIAGHIASSPYPVIVCGDFNDTPVSYTYHKLHKELRDAFRESGRGVSKTYAGHLPYLRIDYILHSRTYESFGFQRIGVELSDHYPISCYVRKKSE
jgi:endonuclease/exonuclease/phosphatase family metal-dependent hydrolase